MRFLNGSVSVFDKRVDANGARGKPKSEKSRSKPLWKEKDEVDKGRAKRVQRV